VMAWASGGAAEGDHASETRAPEARCRDVYVYFDNDAKVRAPFDAQGLMKRVEKRELREQGSATDRGGPQRE